MSEHQYWTSRIDYIIVLSELLALHNKIGAKRHHKKVNKILADGLEWMTKAWDHNPEKLFSAFSEMLAEVLKYFQRDERQWDNMQLKELRKLLSQHCRELK
ncbi:hypothetical protein EV182_001531 [Spiromyces aspiralis]|uniref:Uncharacterized protein n=1 Tax=Spiromyces aspiralis TaxID=68401 RepID=A0ACC1HWH9_9FUNG|nr:hypothetical protein EV182_001531 [Spiromyces aspiralis]